MGVENVGVEIDGLESVLQFRGEGKGNVPRGEFYILAREIPWERLKFSRIREDGERMDDFAFEGTLQFCNLLYIVYDKICENLQGDYK